MFIIMSKKGVIVGLIVAAITNAYFYVSLIRKDICNKKNL